MSAPHAPHAAPHGSPSAAASGRAPADRLSVSIVTPEGLAYEGEARSVVVPAHDGEVAFFPLHAAYVGALGFGELRIAPLEGAVLRWYLEGGVAEVAGPSVTVLAERVLPVARIDVARARRELEDAVASVPADEPAEAAREHAISSAQARLRVAGAAAAAPAPH